MLTTPAVSRSQSIRHLAQPRSLHQEPGHRRHLPTGRYLLIYSDVDAHWSLKDQVLTLLASDDRGASWYKYREIDRADLAAGDERLVTPRLSLLNDGRLVNHCRP